LNQTAQPEYQTLRTELRKQAKRAGENFSVLSPLLPRAFIDDFAAVYAFCRRADDIADEVEPTPQGRQHALDALGQFRSALISHLDSEAEPGPEATAEHPDGAMLARLAEVVRRRAIRHEHLHRLLDAFERDQRQLRYESWEDLLSYCTGSADPVGRMVLEIGGLDTTDPTVSDIVRWSDLVCTALQLTNHWQDVRGDLLDRDRIYMPRGETGLDEADLRRMIENPKDPELRVRYIRALRPLVERTAAMFAEARPLAPAVSETSARAVAPTVRLLALGGEATLRRIERTGCTTIYRRPALGNIAKLMLVGRAWLESRRFR
jgi:squalene synthase HpnC